MDPALIAALRAAQARAAGPDAVPHCARCGAALMLCACEGVEHGRDVVFVLDGPALPEDASAEQRMERWLEHAQLHPTMMFDCRRFLDDMRARGILQAFSRLLPRLEAMAAHYCRDDTAGGYLNERGAAYSKEQLRGEVLLAVRRFARFDWCWLTTFDMALVNNCYQASDPAHFPLEDPDLKLGFDVLGCLQQVYKFVSDRLSYCFEPFEWQ
ncbi:hypothetical protein ABPG75_006618 [Micractinium tetrahymenae]